jgi:hypothetical protein
MTNKETGAREALPAFREIMLKAYAKSSSAKFPCFLEWKTASLSSEATRGRSSGRCNSAAILRIARPFGSQPRICTRARRVGQF